MGVEEFPSVCRRRRSFILLLSSENHKLDMTFHIWEKALNGEPEDRIECAKLESFDRSIAQQNLAINGETTVRDLPFRVLSAAVAVLGSSHKMSRQLIWQAKM
jgi:hypothetical protein